MLPSIHERYLVQQQPQELIDTFMKEHHFKLKGTGPISFHLGCDFYREADGTLCFAPRKYITKVIENYKRLFGEVPPKKASSPLEHGDHPELDTSPLLNIDGIKIYQSLIGSLQWAIQIGRFDGGTACHGFARSRDRVTWIT